MAIERVYESPKRGAGAPLRSAWIADSDTRTRAHLEQHGWRAVEQREIGAKSAPPLQPATAADSTQDEIDRLLAELKEVRSVRFIERLRAELANVKGELAQTTEGAPDAPISDEQTVDDEPPAPEPISGDQLGVTEAQAVALIAAGYDTADKLRAAPDDTLRAIEGIGPAAVRNLRKALAAL